MVDLLYLTDHFRIGFDASLAVNKELQGITREYGHRLDVNFFLINEVIIIKLFRLFRFRGAYTNGTRQRCKADRRFSECCRETIATGPSSFMR